jgi:demethylmenaquinone methyltransferase/2-methoxy-6-polyprenyl-1,4-benzoquinol methylase
VGRNQKPSHRSGLNKQPVGVEIFNRIADRYDAISKFLSLGLIPLWQRKLVEGVERACFVLDLACGTGDVLKLLRLPAFAVGLDYSMPMLKVAKEKAKNAHLVRGNALALPFKDGVFDTVVVSLSLRHFEDTETALKEIRRVLKAGGRVRILEVGIPENPVLSRLFVWFLRHILLPVGRLRSKGEVTLHLYRTIVEFPHRERLIELAFKTGFKGGSYENLAFGMAVVYELTG